MAETPDLRDLGPHTVLYDPSLNPPPARATPSSPLLAAAVFTLLPARPGPVESMGRFHDVRWSKPVFTSVEADQLRVPILVLAGQQSLTHFLPHASIDIATGCPFVRAGRIFLPCLHPFDKPGWATQGETGHAMAVLAKLQLGQPVSWFLGARCMVGGCGRWAKQWDVEAVPWCEHHWAKRGLSPTEKAWARKTAVEKVRAKAMVRVKERRQGVLHG